jgi:hypothetical protein
MKKTILGLSLLFVFTACNESNSKEDVTPEELKAGIKEMDDSLNIMTQKVMNNDDYQMDKVAYHEAIKRNKKFYAHFSDHQYAEQAAQKIAALYLQLNIESEAVKWRDTVLLNYPENKNKLGLLELQMNYYDYNEYTPKKIKYYGKKILAMENLPPKKREAKSFRLKHIDKTFDELIQMQNQNDKDSLDTIPS